MHLDPSYLMECFASGLLVGVRVTQHGLGTLAVPSGLLAACDPFVFADEVEPFTLPVPTGEHNVVVTLAESEGETRVAFVRLQLSDLDPVSWDLMTVDGQDQSQLGPHEIFGVPVDAGTGCLADHESVRELASLLAADADYSSRIFAEMEKTRGLNWSALNWLLPSGLNVVVYTSGYGDGIYPTYVGLAADGTIVCVVSDIQVRGE